MDYLSNTRCVISKHFPTYLAIVLSFMALTGCQKEPNASFIVTQESGIYPLNVTFISKSNNAEELIWDFGDGSFGEGAEVNHTYNSPGIFTAKLTAKNGSKSDFSSKSIEVKSPVGAKVHSIKIVSRPTDSNNGSPWDGTGDGPDIYITVSAGGVVINTTETNYDEFSNSQTIFSFDPSISIVNLSTNYSFRIYDEDLPSGPTLMGSLAFSFSELASQSFPSTFQINQNNYVLEFVVTWI